MTQSVVIPFPRTLPALREQDRLRCALEDLQSALAEQKRALSDWRFAMTELGVSVAGLGHALGNYQHSLGGVETRLTGLRTEACRLEDWSGIGRHPAVAHDQSPSGTVRPMISNAATVTSEVAAI